MSRLTDILEAADAIPRKGGFGEFARRNPRRTDPRASKGARRQMQKDATGDPKPEWKNPNRTKMDDIKDKAGAFKKRWKQRAEDNRFSTKSRGDRRQAKIAVASDSAQAAIDSKTPMANKFNAQRAKSRDETQAHTTNRTLKRGDYEAERRAGRQQQQRQPLKLVPLQQADEAKVRQLAKRLSGKQAAQLGEFINNIIANSKAKSEGTAEQVAKRQGLKQ